MSFPNVDDFLIDILAAKNFKGLSSMRVQIDYSDHFGDGELAGGATGSFSLDETFTCKEVTKAFAPHTKVGRMAFDQNNQIAANGHVGHDKYIALLSALDPLNMKGGNPGAPQNDDRKEFIYYASKRGRVEINRITCLAATDVFLADDTHSASWTFTVAGPNVDCGNFYVWYKVDGVGVDPETSDEGIMVDVPADATANKVARLTRERLALSFPFSADISGHGPVVIVTGLIKTTCPKAQDVDTGFGFVERQSGLDPGDPPGRPFGGVRLLSTDSYYQPTLAYFNHVIGTPDFYNGGFNFDHGYFGKAVMVGEWTQDIPPESGVFVATGQYFVMNFAPIIYLQRKPVTPGSPSGMSACVMFCPKVTRISDGRDFSTYQDEPILPDYLNPFQEPNVQPDMVQYYNDVSDLRGVVLNWHKEYPGGIGYNSDNQIIDITLTIN